MTRHEIAERVIKTTARELKVNPSVIKETDQFSADLGADSLKSIELVAAFEEEFGLNVVEEEALAVQSVGSAIDYFHGIINR
ncbi:MAG TPA: phosphopantetheine-binding protein [Cyclobacteriaceae bacterium]|nr:phosphopantetheine-binding protein [Cyclobacteriaceae bacterium]